MIIIFNLFIIGLVFLIAYWWANEGLFSSILHLVCVITAGVITFSLWEPLTMRVLNGGAFDNYAWGVILVGVFCVSLFLLRVTADKVVPANIKFPSWANYGIGGITGACSGVLTIGICLIGSGFIQSTNELMGYQGTARSKSTGLIGKVGDPIWLDVSNLTSAFFSMLSVGTMHPDIQGGALAHYNPKVDELSTLMRDTFDNGKGQLSLAPNAATITKVASNNQGLIVVQVSFNTKAKDHGGQLIIASSQVRLIGDPNGSDSVDVYHPTAWKQESNDGVETLYRFDDINNYATSVPGRQDTGIKFAFDTKNRNFKPKFIQLRGTRFELPSGEPLPISELSARLYQGRKLTAEEIEAERDSLGKDISHLFRISSKIKGLRISINGIPSTIAFNEDNYLLEGTLTSKWSQSGTSSKMAVKGIYADDGTAIVQLKVSPGTNASFGFLTQTEPESSVVNIIDSEGRKYSPIGYIIGDDKLMQLTLSPTDPPNTLGDLPMHLLSKSRSKDMTLIFQVTEDKIITEFQVGNVTIGTCEIKATRGSR
ncbi:MAG TPA: CvpA family protein [Phycisphaerales bacterium]|nr:CvpA family protein [Phycisphaerales bacterium]HIB51091.1 CvpA family protein [Phycisphaerales bacterium]HIN84447.1 CvpA family protein [Phycisphaerales bacterium]HIO20087.1 CvpA family protein [Phycisphaerales bacterium]HIO52783.1 CvpA family protein [Phycisphaerales bacterium]